MHTGEVVATRPVRRSWKEAVDDAVALSDEATIEVIQPSGSGGSDGL